MTETDRDSKRKSGGKLLRSGVVVSMMTLISRVLGLARDMVIAYFFGSAAGADAFFLAFRIPNFFRRLFAEGAFSQAFVPVLSEYKAKRDHEEVKQLVDRTAGSLGLVLLMMTSFGVLGAELVISVFAPGYLYHGEGEKFVLAVDMLRLTFPYLFLISMTALSGAILNTYGRFAAPAFTPVLLNVSLIACAILMRDQLDEPVMALAWGVLVAGVAQLTFQVPFLAKIRLVPIPKVGFKDEGVRRVGTLMLPAIFGASVSQINLLVDTLLASFLDTGSLSWLYYSDRLLELPLALFGITVATVILPGLSREHAENSKESFSRTLDWALRIVLLFGLPASVALVFLSDRLIATLFFQGEMTTRDVAMAGMSLGAYGAGLLGHMFVKVLAPGYFARQDTKTPVRFGIIAMVTNMVLNLLLILHFKHVGLAMATSLSAFLNAALLYWGLRRDDILEVDTSGWLRFITQVAGASLVLLVGLFYFVPPIEWWLDNSFLTRLMWMLLICVAGAVIYAASLLMLGVNLRKLVR
ncbi:MAG: murein biosynthesis integral membrane protein MurJ [Pseudomonadales bacterium]|nr:murein biosynthesis integral membrane protein MurJ [Pseudomonadales bacterium]MBO6597987.1 murein biosynthesis integral membrane protein MurJ [Pseudomonadales bacterium]MBO6822991.1 murein biosynthesis integral membrane protein MurJ [Pseudomonadales bacterium]